MGPHAAIGTAQRAEQPLVFQTRLRVKIPVTNATGQLTRCASRSYARNHAGNPPGDAGQQHTQTPLLQRE